MKKKAGKATAMKLHKMEGKAMHAEDKAKGGAKAKAMKAEEKLHKEEGKAIKKACRYK